ncbi:MAG: PAS domain-containing protein [Deltaproteobacteria bacterium]|nr:PAS domain-containing protein [Deltaproteobacteria bacterium]
MGKKEKTALVVLLGLVTTWITFILIGLPVGTKAIFREVGIVTVLIAFLIYYNFSFLKKWRERIKNSDSIETALAKYNYFAFCTSEEEIIIYCNEKFLNTLGYGDIIFVAGKHLSEIFKKDTFIEIEKFLNSQDKDVIKYLTGYIFSKSRTYIYTNIIVQKFIIRGRRYEHIAVIDSEFFNLLATYLPKNLIQILDSIEDAIIYLDQNQNIRWLNKSGERFLNSKPLETIIGKRCYEVFYSKDTFCENCPVQKTLNTGESTETEIQLLDGRHLLVKSEPVKDKSGEIKGITKIIRDITQQKEEEIRKIETESRLALITEQLPTLIWTVDDNLKVTYLNGTVLNYLKISKDDLIGKTLFELFNTTDPEHPVIKHALLAMTGESGSYQIKVMNRHYIVYYRPFINYEGKISGCAGVSQDITDLIDIQKELEERNKILALIGNINKVISRSKTEEQMIEDLIKLFGQEGNIKNVFYVVKDDEKDLLVINKALRDDELSAFLNSTKITENDKTNNPLTLCYLDLEIETINNVESSNIESTLKSLLIKNGYKSIIFIPIIVDQRIHSIFCIASDKKDFFKNAEYFKSIASDVSVATSNFALLRRQRENEEAIKKNQLMLTKAQKYEYISRFATQLAHDFNNLLFSIKSYIEIIRSNIDPNSKIEEYLNRIDSSITKGSQLASYVMLYSHFEPLNKKELQILDLYETAYQKISSIIQEKSGKLLSANKCPEDTNILCDKDKLCEAIEICTRYIINRSLFDSQIYFFISSTDRDKNTKNDYEKEMIKIEIMTDSPISEDILTNDIFEIRLPNEIAEQLDIKLPIINKIIRLHGGYIYTDKVKDKIGFVIILPKLEDTSKELDKRPYLANKAKNILIVEDDPYVKQPLEIFFKDLKCNILTASNGLEALRLARMINYDIHLLITDIEMPIIDGIALSEEIYKNNNNMKIIYISGYVKDFASKEGRLIPNSYFLQKPFHLESLKKIVLSLL